MNVTDRFLRYVKFDTQSDEQTNLWPSTPGQMKFAQALEKELHAMGLDEISLDENGYLMATLPANTDAQVPVVGFIAHLDTSPDMSGHNVKPRIVEKYDGSTITLNADKGIFLSPDEFPELLDYVGQDLIVTDGTTLLGADDKAGIAEINGKTLDLSGLPVAPYEEDGVVMVPLRKVGEALGYRVGWDAETGAITIDDDYIQGATLFDGSAKAVFTGHLKVIDMSREIENALPTVVHTGGYTFVPAGFFSEFFNDVTVENGVITIAPSMCELD